MYLAIYNKYGVYLRTEFHQVSSLKELRPIIAKIEAKGLRAVIRSN